MADERSFGNSGNGMPSNQTVFRRGADPPKNESGMTGSVSALDLSDRYVISGNGTCIAAQTFSHGELLRYSRSMEHTRSLRSSKAMMLSSSDVLRETSLMSRSKAGQMSSASIVRCPGTQTSRRLRRRGDPKTTFLHRRHTCTSDCHASIPCLYPSDRLISIYKSNISSRTSSGSTSIRITWPTSHQISQQSLQDVA